MNVSKSKLCLLGGLSAAALLILSLSGCSQHPLDSLKDDQLSIKYPESFWDKQQKVNSELWQQAIKICSDAAYKGMPNCGSVHSIEMFSNPLPYHKYGEGKGFGEMPKIS